MLLAVSCFRTPKLLASAVLRAHQSVRNISPRVAAAGSGPEASQHSAPKSASGRRGKLQAYIDLIRLNKPTGTILALTPSLWAVGLATPATMSHPDLRTVAIFMAGAVVARGMGCTLNDILDRNIDKHVERTKMRPIACGDLSVKEALVYLGGQSIAGLSILCMNNLEVIKLGLFSGLLISTYPLFKRFTYWPQAMLAITINWGVPMGYAAVKGAIHLNDLPILLPIYLSSIFWTLYYDTIYAHQDKTDDKFIGVKSTALKFGSQTKGFLNQMVGGMALSLALAGVMTEQTIPYYMTILATAIYQNYQVRSLDLDNKEDCWVSFKRQSYVGFLIWGGILLSVAKKFKDKSSTPELEDVQLNVPASQ